MPYPYQPKTVCAVSLLLFATSIGHVIISGEPKSHIKDLLYSPVSTGDYSRHIVDQRSAAAHISDCYCQTDGWSGRLGNRIILTSKMVRHAESLSCGVHIPENMLSGWAPPEHSWARVGNETLDKNNNTTCESRTGKAWFTSKPQQSSSTSHLQLLRKYFNINQTHVLGKTCSSSEHVALHIRSGDVVRGGYSKEGTFKPGSVPQKYGLYPTSYYISVIREVRARRGNDVSFIAFCETMGNPTCEFFEKLSTLDQNVVLRVGQPLKADLRLMLCASEVAESKGSFKVIFQLSPKPLVRHKFSRPPVHGKKKCLHIFHWMSSFHQAAHFVNVTKEWTNTGFQRHEVNAAYEFTHSEMIC